MNQVTLIGNLAADPELSTAGGIDQVRVEIATTRRISGPDGTKDRVTWTPVLAFHGLAQSLSQLGKGSRLLVQARLDSALHEDGETCFNYNEVVAEDVEILAVQERASDERTGPTPVPPLQA